MGHRQDRLASTPAGLLQQSTQATKHTRFRGLRNMHAHEPYHVYSWDVAMDEPYHVYSQNKATDKVYHVYSQNVAMDKVRHVYIQNVAMIKVRAL